MTLTFLKWAIPLILIVLIGNVIRRKLIAGKIHTWTRCVVDTILGIPKLFGVSVWSKKVVKFQTIIDSAMKKTGLIDIAGGEKDITQKYDLCLAKGFEKSKLELSPFGYFALNESLTRVMATRLQLIQFSKTNAAQLSLVKAVKNPIFVIGFPRTGTTFLHELLGRHPDVRSHHTWEQHRPVPLTSDLSPAGLARDRAARKAQVKTEESFGGLIRGQAIQVVHRIGYDEPEECTLPCAMSLPWHPIMIGFTTFVSSELFPMGAGDAFQMYRKFLQVLSFQAEDRQGDFTWMLKCPFHLPYLDELFEEFPDATVVWTHRDPAECVASACKLYETLFDMISEPAALDKIALGRAVVEYTKLSLELGLNKIKKAGTAWKVVHVRYEDNIKDPRAVCRSILESSKSLSYSTEYESKLNAYLYDNEEKRKAVAVASKASGGKKVMHTYSLEEYGLSAPEISKEFKEYIDMFNLREK